MTTIIIGAGPMGLACAHYLASAGHKVAVYEADDRLGGMSACFDLGGLRIERYYHFICKTDYALFDLLKELGLSDRLRWNATKMGYFYHGKLYPWGNPWALLTFPALSMWAKIRYARHVLHAKGIANWESLDEERADVWIKRWVGQEAWDVLWEKLFALKFFEYKDQLSASWIGTRIARVAKSRKNIFTEEMGYLEGGSDVLLKALEKSIVSQGGSIHLKTPVQEVLVRQGRACGIRIHGQEILADRVISTAPLPYVPDFMPHLPAEDLAKIKAISNVGVVCPIFLLKNPLTANFWLNTNDPGMAIPGIIEYTNLRPMGRHVVYVPFYVPSSYPRYQQPDAEIIAESIRYFKQVNPAFQDDWVVEAKVSRYRYAQTVCPPGFSKMLPPMRSAVPGFFMADTAYYYPEDRSITESVGAGKRLAALAFQG
jgi:protoporphyrinogen oxidase